MSFQFSFYTVFSLFFRCVCFTP